MCLLTSMDIIWYHGFQSLSYIRCWRCCGCCGGCCCCCCCWLFVVCCLLFSFLVSWMHPSHLNTGKLFGFANFSSSEGLGNITVPHMPADDGPATWRLGKITSLHRCSTQGFYIAFLVPPCLQEMNQKTICPLMSHLSVSFGCFFSIWRTANSLPGTAPPRVKCADAVAKSTLAASSTMIRRLKYSNGQEGNWERPTKIRYKEGTVVFCFFWLVFSFFLSLIWLSETSPAQRQDGDRLTLSEMTLAQHRSKMINGDIATWALQVVVSHVSIFRYVSGCFIMFQCFMFRRFKTSFHFPNNLVADGTMYRIQQASLLRCKITGLILGWVMITGLQLFSTITSYILVYVENYFHLDAKYWWNYITGWLIMLLSFRLV